MNDKEYQLDSIDTLRRILNEGDTVYGLVTHRTPNGSNYCRFMAVVDGEIRDISAMVSSACGYSWSNQRQAVKVVASGMSAIFKAVYNLSIILFSDRMALKYRAL